MDRLMAIPPIDDDEPEHQHSFTVVVEWGQQAKQEKYGDTWMLNEDGEWREVNNSQARRLVAKSVMCPSCLMVRPLTGDSNSPGGGSQ
jgi:hypothetical protein